MVRRKVEDSDIGLKVLYEPPAGTNPNYESIVTVHGIGAHPQETWSARVKQEGGDIKWLNWLSDETMLPCTLSDMRVLNFGYKSDWFGSPVQHSLSSLGSLLWTSLNMKREKCLDRPIIFVAHCFGGLIVMRVLIERSQWSIARATAGIAFLGTPFRGTDDRFHLELPRMAEVNIGTVDDRILHYLRKDNSTLEDLRDGFLQMRLRSKVSGMPRVMCFYECLETQVNKIVDDPQPLKFIVVDKGSATLDLQEGIERYAFQRNHFQLNKFKSPADEDFQFLSVILGKFKNLAISNVRPQLETDSDNRYRSVVRANTCFDPRAWRESPLTVFNVKDMSVGMLKIRQERNFSPSSSGISLDCHHMFLCDDHSIRVYSVADIQRCHPAKSIPVPVLTYRDSLSKKSEPNSQEICGVSIGRTFCASITTASCSLHEFIGEKKHQIIRHMSHENTWALRCVAVSETTVADDLIIVALGLQREENGTDFGRVELYCIWQNDWRETTRIQTMELRDPVTGINDSPKTLSFSLDGAILICTTQRHNQVHGWQLPTAEALGKIKKISATTRPFNIGVNAKGITTATAWMSPAQRPYVLCTTSPSTERDVDGGEWTFIAPLSMPFAPWATERAYHCLRQIQGDDSKHLHIQASAISPQGNLVALLDSNGRVCLIPIRARKRGGMVSEDSIPPVDVKPALGRNEDLMAGIRFNLSGTELYAINWNGIVLVISFPHAYSTERKPEIRRAPTSVSQTTASSPQERSSIFSTIQHPLGISLNNEPQPQARVSTTFGSDKSASTSSTNFAPDDAPFSETCIAAGSDLAFKKSDQENGEFTVSQLPPEVSKSKRFASWRWSLKGSKTKDKETNKSMSVHLTSPATQSLGAAQQSQSTILPELSISSSDTFSEEILSKFDK